MEQIKEAFSKIKKDIESLNNDVSLLRSDLTQTREELIKICEIMINLDKKISATEENRGKVKEKQIPTHNPINSTTPTHNPTHNLPLNDLKSLNNVFSSGNEGVPTDRQTNKQTDNEEQNPTHIKENNPQNFNIYTDKFPLKTQNITQIQEKNEDFRHFDENSLNSIDNAAKILDSLDTLKKEIRLKFKRLTGQEMIVFSTLYQLEEELGEIDYKILSKRMNLTESSVRDYIGRLIKKGIPVEKKRINNKTILLSVSTNLKKIASLSTIMHLRDL